jgi:hypothetical protein
VLVAQAMHQCLIFGNCSPHPDQMLLGSFG